MVIKENVDKKTAEEIKKKIEGGTNLKASIDVLKRAVCSWWCDNAGLDLDSGIEWVCFFVPRLWRTYVLNISVL